MTGFLDDPARAAAVTAARERIEPGMTIGLGSGRAVFALVDLLATTWPGPRPLRAVAASARTEARARAAGIELAGLDEDRTLDLAVDGADEVDPALRLLKGGGGALLREKLVIAAARHVVIVAESPKLVPQLGTTKALPVEVVRFAWPATRSRLLTLLPTATLRPTPEGPPFITDEGHHLLDCTLPATDLPTLATTLKATLGVVDHGLFIDQADEVLVGHPDGSVQLLRADVARNPGCGQPGAPGRWVASFAVVFPSMKARQLLAVLSRPPLRYRVVRQTGSHRLLRSAGGYPPLTFAWHDRATARVVRDVLVNDVGLSVQEALRCLRKVR